MSNQNWQGLGDQLPVQSLDGNGEQKQQHGLGGLLENGQQQPYAFQQIPPSGVLLPFTATGANGLSLLGNNANPAFGFQTAPGTLPGAPSRTAAATTATELPSNLNASSLLTLLSMQQQQQQQQQPQQITQPIPQQFQLLQLAQQPAFANFQAANTVSNPAAQLVNVNYDAQMARLSSQSQPAQISQLVQQSQQQLDELLNSKKLPGQEQQGFKIQDYQVDLSRVDRRGFTRESWDMMFERLVKYREEHGHCLVPQKYADDRKLGNWVKVQRQTEASMCPEKKMKLNSVGFCWRLVKKTQREPWDVMYQSLVRYKEKFGNCLVPKRFLADRKLGRWVHWQRERQDCLSEERRNKLNKLGFVWRNAGRRVPTAAQAAKESKANENIVDSQQDTIVEKETTDAKAEEI